MYRFLALSFFSATSLSTAFAADIDLDSNIREVLVFPDGAQVTRFAEGAVPTGDHVIVVDDLPENVQPDTVRVSGKTSGSILQNSVDVRQIVLTSGDQPGERDRLRKQIDDLEFENEALDRKRKDIGLQRNLLQTLATRSLGASTSNQEDDLPSAGLDGLLESVAMRLGKLLNQENAARLRQIEIGKEIVTLETRMSQLAPKNRVQTVVHINVAASEAGDAAFEIAYQVNQAGWRPHYDARLSIGENADNASMEFVSRAEVFQNTGEAWKDVVLSLSTTRPSSATRPPELYPYEIDARPGDVAIPLSMKRKEITLSQVESRLAEQTEAEGLVATDLAAAVTEPVVAVETAGFHAVFEIPGTASVDNNGETKSVTIDQFEATAELFALSVPRFDQTAYLMATYKHEGVTPLLPGKVSLTRDGIFVGKGHLPMIAVGETHELGFGADDQVAIERVETDKEKGEGGFISTVNTDRRSYKTTVTNRHDFDLPIRIVDHIPVSNQEDITIELSGDTTPPGVVDKDDRRGILAWEKSVGADEKWEITLGYEVSWPDDVKIRQVN